MLNNLLEKKIIFLSKGCSPFFAQAQLQETGWDMPFPRLAFSPGLGVFWAEGNSEF